LEKTERAVYDQMASDMAVTNIQRQYQPLFDWLQILDQNMFVFMLLMLMVASFNMVSILLVMMTERTPTIGLLKALGSANWQIRQVFIYNGLWMITWGLLLGNVVGLGLCWLQKTYRIIPLDPTNYFMDSVPIAWNWPAIGLINVGTLVLISLMLLLPTLIILRIEPVKAIIFKK
jgi:lipoprotein-releasing system permease protein